MILYENIMYTFTETANSQYSIIVFFQIIAEVDKLTYKLENLQMLIY